MGYQSKSHYHKPMRGPSGYRRMNKLRPETIESAVRELTPLEELEELKQFVDIDEIQLRKQYE